MLTSGNKILPKFLHPYLGLGGLKMLCGVRVLHGETILKVKMRAETVLEIHFLERWFPTNSVGHQVGPTCRNENISL